MGLLAWANSHSNVKLYWSVKKIAECLVQAVDGALGNIREKDVRVGRRLDIWALLSQEVDSGWGKIGAAVCGASRTLRRR